MTAMSYHDIPPPGALRLERYITARRSFRTTYRAPRRDARAPPARTSFAGVLKSIRVVRASSGCESRSSASYSLRHSISSRLLVAEGGWEIAYHDALTLALGESALSTYTAVWRLVASPTLQVNPVRDESACFCFCFCRSSFPCFRIQINSLPILLRST